MQDTLKDFLEWSRSNYRLPQFIDDAYSQFQMALQTHVSEAAATQLQEAISPSELLSHIWAAPTSYKLTRARLVAHWREEYLRYIQKPPRKLYAHEGKLLDKLIICYNSSPDILSMITAFMEHYKKVPGFTGYPTVGALWGWKDTLMNMAIEGVKTKQGQHAAPKAGTDEFG